MAVVDPVALFLAQLREARVLEPAAVDGLAAQLTQKPVPPDALGRDLVARGILTAYQAERALAGRSEDLALGQYVVLERIGQGGTGEVFKAQHRVMRRLAAVKIIRRELLASAEAVQRFYREVEASGRLRHPHIVEAFDAGPCGETHFLAMEYVEGTNLTRLVKERGPLPAALAINLIRQGALGLQHAHDRGLVHRDIKPSNLILAARGGRVRLLDLGLARMSMNPGDEEPTLTEVGAFVGTVDFIAPEQAEDSHAVDHRADLYSLGATLYFLLSGRVPHPGGNLFQKLNRLKTVDPTPLESLCPTVPPELTAVVRRLLAKNPGDRFQTATELIAALDAVPLAGDTEAAAPSVDTADGTLADQSVTRIGGDARANHADARRRMRGRVLVGAALLTGLAALCLAPLFFGRPRLEEPTASVQDTVLVEVPPPAPPIEAPKPLAPEAQLKQVVDELKVLNPQYDGKQKSTIKNGVVVSLELSADNIADLAPVRALRGLETLVCAGSAPGKGKLARLEPLSGLPALTTLLCPRTAVADLKPLAGAKLTRLDCSDCPVVDLTPLAHMKSLSQLHIYGTKVASLKPLRGADLTVLSISYSKVTSLEDLHGLPLVVLNCNSTGVRDLGPLTGMFSLRELRIVGTKVEDLRPLSGLFLDLLICSGTGVADLKPLQGMPLRQLDCNGLKKLSDLEPLRGMKLGVLYCNGTKVRSLEPLQGMPLIDLRFQDAEVADLTPLRGMPLTTLHCGCPLVADLNPLRGMKLKVLLCPGATVESLEPLHGMPIGELRCPRTRVTDLTPLTGTPLAVLDCAHTKKTNPSTGAVERITTLEPLRDLPLTSLDCAGAAVADLGPLRSLKALNALSCIGCPVEDWSVLKDLKHLQYLSLDFKPETHLALLRSLKSLAKINGKPAADFLREADKPR